MKTIITIDNYEAYLLDYMEGNLSPDEAEQLKAFVAAQGLDWDELTEELPHLEAPQIASSGKGPHHLADSLGRNRLRLVSISRSHVLSI